MDISSLENLLMRVKSYKKNILNLLLFALCALIVLSTCNKLVFGPIPKEYIFNSLGIYFLLFLMLLVFFISAYSVFVGSEKRPFFRFMFFTSLVGLALLLISCYAFLYRFYGILDISGTITNDSIPALYFSIVTWTTLGYGDFRPTEGARLIAASEALVGYFFMAMLTGIFLWLLTSWAKPSNSKV